MAQALIDGRIDCKTAGRLVVHLQMMLKLLWLYHRGHRGTQKEKYLTTKEHEGLPQIDIDERISASGMLKMVPSSAELPANAPACGGAKILQFEVTAFGDRSRAHDPPESKAA